MDRETFKKLKNLYGKTVETKNCDSDTLYALADAGYVEFVYKSGTGRVITDQYNDRVRMTAYGNAEFEKIRSDLRWRYINFTLSVVALLLSITSIVLSVLQWLLPVR